jgi:hypothetical protein
MAANVWNFVQFQAGWFALVLSAAMGFPALGVGAMILLAVVHLAWSAKPKEWLLLLVVTLLGWLWESLLQNLGLIRFAGHGESAMTAPLWMAMLWLNFATVLNHSLAWLKERTLLASLLGACGGPLAFWGGSQFGAASFPDPMLTLAVIAVAWSILLPFVLRLSRQLCYDKNSAAQIDRGCPGGRYADAH